MTEEVQMCLEDVKENMQKALSHLEKESKKFVPEKLPLICLTE